MPKGSSHVFSEVFLHLNWHCLKDKPLLGADVESFLHEFIEEYCRKVKGVHFIEIGGTETHLHLALQVEPFVGLSDFIGKIKGASAHAANRRFGTDAVHWQRGYGVVSFARKHLDAVVRYVRNQKAHHSSGKLNSTLETSEQGEEE